ncbi:mitotic spindle checkpoint protein MAD1 [Nymphaea colorata]|nr:mitotic spindle checkpoint protein MAD1 [Nymphaea colorata]
MIVRTPPAKRKAEAYTVVTPGSAPTSQQLVVYQDPLPDVHDGQPEPMLCTYQCRQMVKSEFIDALNTAEKKVNDLQSSLELLNQQLCGKEAESNKFQSQLRFAEQELSAAKGHEQALQEQLTKEVNESLERYQSQLKQISELEVKLQKEIKQRKDAESSASAAQERSLALEEKLQNVTDTAEREKRHLRKELSLLQSDSKFSISRVCTDLELMEFRASSAEKESELLKKQLEDLQLQLAECHKQKNELGKKLSTISEPSHEVAASEARVLVKHLQEELRSYESEVCEARKLKALHDNTELLKEKIQEERHHREQAEAQLLKLHDVEQNVIKLEDELVKWKSISNEIPGVESSDDVVQKFASLQRELIQSMKQSGELTSQLRQLEVDIEKANLDKNHAERQVMLAERKVEENMAAVRRLEISVASVAAERDRLRAAVASLEGESFAQKNQTGEDAAASNVGETLAKDLEACLMEKESTIKELERNLQEQKEIISNQCCEIRLLNENLNSETRRAKSLEREGDRLRSEISLLESKLGHGDYSAATTKVLRMVNTLAVDNEAKHAIEALRCELQKAQAKLQAIEDLKGQSDASKLVSGDISEKLAQLKGQIAILEKREERYKTVFAEKISVFRRACCSLFGYKIMMDDRLRHDGIPVTMFTLQSIYAQTEEEKLEFEYESGNTTIVTNGYTLQPDISQQVEIFIKRCNSIPAFTANLTIESFNRRTLS